MERKHLWRVAMKRIRGPTKASTRPFKKPRQDSKAPTRSKRAVALAPELKYNDVAFVTDATTTGAVINLNQMAVGDTIGNRDGNKISCKSIQLRFTLANEDAVSNEIVRMMLIWDRQPNGANPTIATASTGPLDTITIQSLRQIATVSRFKCLWDKVYTLIQQNDTATCLQIVHDEVFINLPKDCQLTQFADGTSAAPISGGLYLMYFSTTAAGATDVDMLGQARLRFWG